MRAKTTAWMWPNALTTRAGWNTEAHRASNVFLVPGSGRPPTLHDKKKQVRKKLANPSFPNVLILPTTSCLPRLHLLQDPCLTPRTTPHVEVSHHPGFHSLPAVANHIQMHSTGQLGGHLPEQWLTDLSTSAPSVPASSPPEPGRAFPDATHLQQPSSLNSLDGPITPTPRTLTKFSPVGSHSGHRKP